MAAVSGNSWGFIIVVVVFQLLMFGYLNLDHGSKAVLNTQIEALQAQVNTMTDQLKTVSKDVKAASTAGSQILKMHPGILKYRYTEQDANLNRGEMFNASVALDLALIDDGGHRFWGWNTPDMLEYIFTKIGGEDLVRDIFKYVLGRQQKPKLVLDVGSNVGYFSLLAASLNTQRVYAFDPQRQCAQRVSWSAQANGFQDRVIAINAFVAKEEGKTGKFPINTCGGSFSVNGKYNPEKEILAEVRSLNLAQHFLNDPDAIDLVKVDVEGAELMVLEGSHELFVKHRVRSIVIEITPGWWETRFGYTYEDGARIVKSTLIDTGYKIYLLPIHSSQGKPKLLAGWKEFEKILKPEPGEHNQQNFFFTLDEY